jgi:uncharacterized damage-inducible protein DinB
MRYKAWADAALIDSLLAMPALTQTTEGGYVTTIVRHFHTVDCIFKAHLQGVAHGFTSPNPPEPATLEELQPLVAATDAWYVDYTRELDARALSETLDVTFTDGAQQRLTRADMLLHVALHGGGHRAQVGALLQLRGATPPPDRYTNYLKQSAA